MACYNFDVHQPILIIFGRNVAKKVSNCSALTPILSAQNRINKTNFRLANRSVETVLNESSYTAIQLQPI